MRQTSKLMAIALAIGIASIAQAQTLEKIRSSGSVTLGVRDSSIPRSYYADGLQPVGLHIDICQRVVKAIQKQLGLSKLEVQYQLVTSQNRIPLVQNGTVDLECGSTTNNQVRQKDVAFALTTYLDETRMSVRTDSKIQSLKDLAGKTVVMTTGTTSVQHFRKAARAAGLDVKEVLGKDHADSFLLLESGRADAWILDSGLMSAVIATSKKPSDFKITGDTFAIEPTAIMMRKGDAELKSLVDNTIRDLIRTGEMKTLWAKWLEQPIPPKGVRLNMPPSSGILALWSEPNDLPLESYDK